MRIAHHLAKSDLLYIEINVHMYQVFDHALFPCCVCETTIHDWKGRESQHAIGGLVIVTQSGKGM